MQSRQKFCVLRYVYGEAKQNILDTVPFASPDIKARYFIKKCRSD